MKKLFLLLAISLAVLFIAPTYASPIDHDVGVEYVLQSNADVIYTLNSDAYTVEVSPFIYSYINYEDIAWIKSDTYSQYKALVENYSYLGIRESDFGSINQISTLNVCNIHINFRQDAVI